jgi:leukotriene-A4 hydrolase
VAHELAHSWTGNLITNKTNEDVWLNEVKSQFCHCRPLQSIVLPQKPMS